MSRMYFFLVARSTQNSPYFTPVRPVRDPKTMLQWTTSQKLGGSGKGLVFRFARSMVAVSPRLTIGSLSMDGMEKFDFAVVER